MAAIVRCEERTATRDVTNLVRNAGWAAGDVLLDASFRDVVPPEFRDVDPPEEQAAGL